MKTSTKVDMLVFIFFWLTVAFVLIMTIITMLSDASYNKKLDDACKFQLYDDEAYWGATQHYDKPSFCCLIVDGEEVCVDKWR